MKLKDFDYDLPKELIAQEPIKPRDHSRLLVLFKDPARKKKINILHKHFYDIIDYLQKGDVLVLNNSKVFPARLIGKKKETGGKIEIFLLKENPTSTSAKDSADKPTLPFVRGKSIWQCLVGGNVRRAGRVVEFSKNFQAEILKNNNDGTWEVRFNLIGKRFWQAVEKHGQMPLPPYIKACNAQRATHNANQKDKRNYQTIFADEKKLGSVAAPTAGLHFTKSLLAKIKKKGVRVEYITLHVGLGTFAPVKVDDIKKHQMHSEFAEISKETLQNIFKTKAEGRRVIAVGTTSVRTLEAAASKFPISNFQFPNKLKSTNSNNKIKLLKNINFWTNIFIYPGYKFKVVDAMITNFHLPKSTLFMLVSAMAGRENILRAYQEAIEKKYRFFSYGDAMFIC
jgi:S-adenosylmethionine:tRNA ribosyltransferase-isomerase